VFGDITEGRIAQFADRLSERLFVAGHWSANTLSGIFQKSLIFTILRNPRDHAVSNYLFLYDEPNQPQHNDARDLGFRRFFLENVHLLACQTSSILAARTPYPISAREFVNHADEVLRFLNQLAFVGCLEKPDDLAYCLPAALGLSEPLNLRWLNSATDRRIPKARIAELQAMYDDLARDPALRQLIDIEHQLYNAALARVHGRERALGSLKRSWENAPTVHFAASNPSVMTEIGQKVAEGYWGAPVIRLRQKPGWGVYGPYLDLPPGMCTARIWLAGPLYGNATIQLTGDYGQTILNSLSFDLARLSTNVLELATVLPRPMAWCELRLRCDREVHADVVGMDFRFSIAPRAYFGRSWLAPKRLRPLRKRIRNAL